MHPTALLVTALLCAASPIPARAQCVQPEGASTIFAPAQRNLSIGFPRLGEPAPDFSADSTFGPISLADYRGKWLVLFSHPSDFTPVCTTEFLAFAAAHARFQALGTELLGLSIDSKYSHLAWTRNIEANFGVRIPFPILDDLSMNVANSYGMLHPASSSTAAVRALFVIDPDGVLQAMLYYPMSNGRSVEEVLRLVSALQVSREHHVATPEAWQPGQDVILPPPSTAQLAAERATDPDCVDWYFCRKPLQASAKDAQAEHKAFFAQQLEPYACGSIERLHTVGGWFLASQPSAEDLAQAKLGGVRTVVDQRHGSERGWDESAVVQELGLVYWNPAWNGEGELTDELIDRTREVLRKAELPALLHCSSGNRVGALWIPFRVLDQNVGLEQALQEAKTIGLKSPAYEARVLDYVARHRAQGAGARNAPAGGPVSDVFALAAFAKRGPRPIQ